MLIGITGLTAQTPLFIESNKNSWRMGVLLIKLFQPIPTNIYKMLYLASKQKMSSKTDTYAFSVLKDLSQAGQYRSS